MKVEVLDHGYIELIESWGSDERIIEAARMSTGKGFLGWGPNCPNSSTEDAYEHDLLPLNIRSDPKAVRCSKCGTVELKSGDEKLLKYLRENHHDTPFEFAGLVIEVQAPIFVFREWHRHRTQSYNEMSARYAPLPDFNYIPQVERLLIGGGHLTKQAGSIAGAAELNADTARKYRHDLEQSYIRAQAFYEEALAMGVPKELARIHLPVGRYSRMRASTCLRNWLAFLTLRMAPTAQWEIRQFANEVGRFIEKVFPRTWALFIEGRAS